MSTPTERLDAKYRMHDAANMWEPVTGDAYVYANMDDEEDNFWNLMYIDQSNALGYGWTTVDTCRDCHAPTPLPTYYYLQADLWRRINGGYIVGQLCLPCAQERHGSPFVAGDFHCSSPASLDYLQGQHRAGAGPTLDPDCDCVHCT